MKSTVSHLPGEIEALIPPPERTALIKQIIAEAKQWQFHDYRSAKYTCPKPVLVAMLIETRDPRLNSIAKAVTEGEYDEPPQEEDIDQLRKDWIASGSSPESFDTFFGSQVK